MNKISRAVIGAALLAITGLAAAATVTVNANADSLGTSNGIDTGVYLTNGGAFTVTVPTNEIWNNSGGASAYDSDADGHSDQIYTIRGLTDSIGSLVGQIGDGAYFNVGTDFSGIASGSGDLKLFFFDTDTGNNPGQVTATISAIPEPANLALMGLALGAFALARSRKA